MRLYTERISSLAAAANRQIVYIFFNTNVLPVRFSKISTISFFFLKKKSGTFNVENIKKIVKQLRMRILKEKQTRKQTKKMQ